MRIKNGVVSTKWYKMINKKIKLVSLSNGNKHSQLITSIIGTKESLKLDMAINIGHNIIHSYPDSNMVYLNFTNCDNPLSAHNILNISNKNESYENAEIEFAYNKIMQIVDDKYYRYRDGYIPPTVVILDGISQISSEHDGLEKVGIVKQYNSFIMKLVNLASKSNMIFIQLLDIDYDITTNTHMGCHIIFMSQVVLKLNTIVISNKIKNKIVSVSVLKSRTDGLKKKPEMMFLLNPENPCSIKRNNKRLRMQLKLKDGVYYAKY